MAGPERFELPTAGFEDQNSSTELRTDYLVLKDGIEPSIQSYQDCVMPFNYKSMAPPEGFEPS